MTLEHPKYPCHATLLRYYSDLCDRVVCLDHITTFPGTVLQKSCQLIFNIFSCFIKKNCHYLFLSKAFWKNYLILFNSSLEVFLKIHSLFCIYYICNKLLKITAYFIPKKCIQIIFVKCIFTSAQTFSIIVYA